MKRKFVDQFGGSGEYAKITHTLGTCVMAVIPLADGGEMEFPDHQLDMRAAPGVETVRVKLANKPYRLWGGDLVYWSQAAVDSARCGERTPEVVTVPLTDDSPGGKDMKPAGRAARSYGRNGGEIPEFIEMVPWDDSDER